MGIQTTTSSGSDRASLAWLAPLYQSGNSLRFWIRTLTRNAGRIHWRCWFLIPFVTLNICACSFLTLLSRLMFSRAVALRPMAGPPIFVLGHWRSGTTLLHELMTLDERFAFPTNYECFQPGHFLLSAPLMHWLCGFSAPEKRPMDDMKASFITPGEDEMAIRNLGGPSFYRSLFFPSRADELEASLDIDHLPTEHLVRWKNLFGRYLRQLNYRYDRPLILKSPTRTAHVRAVLELFPDARFVNIVRDPREVHCSTVKLWRTLANLVSLESGAGLSEERVFASQRLMHERLKEARPLVPAGQFCETRFENLTADPIGEMSRIYSELGLGGFEEVKPRIESYFASRSDVRASSYRLSPEQLDRIESELADVISDNGYGPTACS